MRKHILSSLNLTPPALRQIGFKLSKTNGINLGQGLCIMPTPGIVLEAAKEALTQGKNIYSAPEGIIELRQALQKRLKAFNNVEYNTDEIVVTAGSTGAFEAVCNSFLTTGDEVITFTPYYPYHQNALARSGAKIRYIELSQPDWSFDKIALKNAITPKTKFILIINPHNPTGKVFSKDELTYIGNLCREHGIFCVSDEVYEYMTYDNAKHISIASLPELRDCVITMSSYSKTFAITGWRIGFLAAPREIASVLRTIFDQIYVCAPTPLQHAVATGINELGDHYYNDLRSTYFKKRKILGEGLSSAGFTTRNPSGAYYFIAETKAKFPNKSATEVVDYMIDKIGVGGVPATDFVASDSNYNFIRFSYAVPDEMLVEAAKRLATL